MGHVGDGNFHAVPLVGMNDADEVSPAKIFAERITKWALSYEGICSGEHGIGQGKKTYLAAEAGAGIETMRAIKQALDPCSILNPGKII